MSKTLKKISFDKDDFITNLVKEKDSKVSFYHKTGLKIKLFPFITNDSKLANSAQDFRDFQGVIGHCFRVLEGTELPKIAEKELDERKSKDLSQKEERQKRIINKAISLIDEIEPNDILDLKDILRNTIFDKNFNLNVFDKSIFAHQQFHYPAATLKEISKFIAEIFFEYDYSGKGNLKDKLLENKEGQANNILFKLLKETLPDLPSSKKKKTLDYYRHNSDLFEVFREDFEFILEDENLLIDSITDLLKYYFFYYIARLSTSLNNFFDEEKEEDKQYKLFFSLDREKLSKHRLAYTQGWVFLEKRIKNLFSHVCCLEFLSYIQTEESHETYSKLKKYIQDLTEEQKEAYHHSLGELLEYYKGIVSGVDGGWEDFDVKLKNDRRFQDLSEETILQKIYQFWLVINHQFINSKRHRAYTGYSNWFDSFCKQNFLKLRGRAGYSLILNQEMLLFFTRLCVGKEDKIRLKTFWKRLERRGIFFDRKTKEEVVNLFEKINLLEKKSDSGDAQYVKSHI